jgi:thiol:disulfide interchange protein DsbC
MNKLFYRALTGILSVMLCGAVLAADPAQSGVKQADTANPVETAKQADTGKPTDPRAIIAKKFPEVKLEDITPSLIPGVYQLPMGADVAYVSADGKYIIAGDMFEIDTRTNLTEQGRAAARVKLLAKLDDRDLIVFSPQVVKHTITVFTDVECGYCRKLHSQIDQLTKLGVKVRYAAYPRAGPDTDDWHKMEAVWCSKDRQTAITQAKLGQVVKAPNCGATPIAKQYQMGEDLGVRGTPAIFAPNGQYIGGYLPPAELVKQLDDFEAKQKKGS